MDRDIEIMAKTMYGEARGGYFKKNGGLNSLIGVGNVIMNRHLKSDESIIRVCLKPKQFSCWNDSDPNKKVIQNIKHDDEIYKVCFQTAFKIITEEIEDITNGANHYYSSFLKKTPFWAIDKRPTVKIGNHIFFSL